MTVLSIELSPCCLWKRWKIRRSGERKSGIMWKSFVNSVHRIIFHHESFSWLRRFSSWPGRSRLGRSWLGRSGLFKWNTVLYRREDPKRSLYCEMSVQNKDHGACNGMGWFIFFVENIFKWRRILQDSKNLAKIRQYFHSQLHSTTNLSRKPCGCISQRIL
jgi:hypothetical protein